ncbi:uncharacterized protein LOC120347799 [Styela clava]
MNDEQVQNQRHLRLMLGRNNPYQTLVALFVTALFFMFFQANILQNFQRHQMMLRNSGSETHNKAKYVNHFVPEQRAPIRHINPKFAPKFATEIGIKVNGTLLRGVKKANRKYYLPNSNFEFVCFDGNQSIPFHAVNNDYCDCSDGSDEPGTSACANGRFYCEPEHEYLPSSRVNDGICDCCDGSDEWKGVTVAPDLNLPDSPKVLLAPCSNVCNDFEHEKRLEMNIKREGAIAKKEYIEIGKGQDETMYGENGVYYKLSQNCYMYKSPGYIYSVCPYQNVTQSGKDFWIIGRNGTLNDKTSILTMTGGDKDHCPDGKARSSVIQFNCAPADKVRYVSEKETCVYSVKFDTPAACPNQEDT